MSGRICQASGRIARILERQGDGRRGDTSRWGSRLRKSEGEEKRRDESGVRGDREEISFSRNPANGAQTLQSASARSIFRIRLGRARFVARRSRRLRPC